MVLPSTVHAAFHKAAHYFGVEPVRGPGRRRLPRRRRGDRRRRSTRPRPDRAGGRVARRRTRTASSTRSPSSRRCGGRARDPVPRRRVHRRLGAAVRRAAGPRRAPVDVRGRRRHLDLGRPAQVRLRAQGHLAAAAPDARSCGAPQFFASADWPGYTMLNSTMQSTKSGGPLAGAWAVVESLGDEGYLRPDPRGVRGRRPDRRRDRRRCPVSSWSSLPTRRWSRWSPTASCDAFTVCDEMTARGLVRPAADVVRRPAADDPPVGERGDLGTRRRVPVRPG